MCKPNLRAAFWGLSLMAVSLISIMTDWDGGSFWAVFFALIAFGVVDGNRRSRSC